MPTFDIVSKIDLQEVDNSVNITKKVISTRYDFRKSRTELAFNKKEKRVHLATEDEMKLKAVQGELVGALVKRGVDPKAFEFGETEPTSKSMIKQEVLIREGIDMDTARRIVKMIKGSKLKVQAQIQDQQVRVSGKKIDDLQSVIQLVKEANLDLPLQYVNMKS